MREKIPSFQILPPGADGVDSGMRQNERGQLVRVYLADFSRSLCGQAVRGPSSAPNGTAADSAVTNEILAPGRRVLISISAPNTMETTQIPEPPHVVMFDSNGDETHAVDRAARIEITDRDEDGADELRVVIREVP